MKDFLTMKLIALLLCVAYVSSQNVEETELRCNLKLCGSDLLNFEGFNIIMLFKKMEAASFCVKNCTPPVVHEFFQGIIYGITKRIPGHCSGTECVDKNRFVALAKCVEDEAWPLLQCSKRLIDLAQVGLVVNQEEEKRNTTCRIVTETVQCIEETLQICGEQPFALVKEILGDLIKAGINAYCHPAYRHEGLFLKRTTRLPTTPFTGTPVTGSTEVPPPHPQFVKGYRTDSAHGLSALSYASLLGSLLLSGFLSYYQYQ